MFSSVTVLSMAVVSTIRQMKKGFKITRPIIAVTTGAIAGGVLGSMLFSILLAAFEPNIVTIVQSIILICLLLFCLIYEKLPHKIIKSKSSQPIIGLALGLFSSFLGIGGGPINVAVLCIFMGLALRDSAKVSIFIILFSQIAGILTKVASGLLTQVQDYSILLGMIPMAIIGGLLGAYFNIQISDKNIKILFKVSVIIVICICVFNVYKGIIIQMKV